jgi:hypothetical protein
MQYDPALHQLVTLIAQERGLRVEHDTHYDAFNWEIRWWAGNVLHAVDIQPYPEGWVELSRLRTHFPMLPRLLAWTLQAVPMLPRGDRTSREPLATLAWPSESARVLEVITLELPGNR